MSRSVTVVGGGFKGLIASYFLIRKGYHVKLIERSPVVGGIMYSRDWNGFKVDNGVQIFDSIPSALAEIVDEVMEGDVLPVGFNYGSVYNDKTTPGLAIPDLSHLDETTKAMMLYDLVQRVARPIDGEPQNVYETFDKRYGPRAAELLDASFRHIYRVSSREVEPDVLRQTAYHRLRLLDDDMALVMKDHPAFEPLLAAKRRKLVKGVDSDLVSVYPKGGGMRAFCVKMDEWLRKHGAQVLTDTAIEKVTVNGAVQTHIAGGETVETDRMFWACDHPMLGHLWQGDRRLMDLVNKTPMVVYYYSLNRDRIKDYTYLHQFTPGRLVFRPSAAGVYSDQIREDNSTYISVECPTDIGSDLWENPAKYTDAAWDETVAADLVEDDGTRYQDVLIAKAPVTHRMPKVGSDALCNELDDKVAATGGKMVIPDRKAFVRRELYGVVEASMDSF